jgi:hypothetical protein
MKHNLATASFLFSELHVPIVAQKIKHNVAKNTKIKHNLAKTSDPAPDHKCDQQQLRGELAECMVRRLNAREKLRMKESLRQCIRPLGGEFSPGLDEIRRVPVL